MGASPPKNLFYGSSGITDETVDIFLNDPIQLSEIKDFPGQDLIGCLESYSGHLLQWFIRRRERILSCILSDNAAYFAAYHNSVIRMRCKEAIEGHPALGSRKPQVEGLVKAVLCSAEYSQKIWDMLLQLMPESKNEIRVLKTDLDEFIGKGQGYFPNARTFRRPGVDGGSG